VTVRLRSTFALLLALAASPLSAQVVGHLPSESPFSDATGRHVWSGYTGYLASVQDRAGVGPSGGLLLAVQYEYDFPGALLLTARAGLAPFSERRVLDPLFKGPPRNFGTRREALMMFDTGLSWSLTGEKAWRGIAPRVFTNVGYLGATNSSYDIGQYRFGPKFTYAYGLNIRGVTGKDWEWRAELSQVLYRLNYPGSYRGDGSETDESIIGASRSNPWSPQTMLSFGIARLWGR
jgi:hypothetical protein